MSENVADEFRTGSEVDLSRRVAVAEHVAAGRRREERRANQRRTSPKRTLDMLSWSDTTVVVR